MKRLKCTKCNKKPKKVKEYIGFWRNHNAYECADCSRYFIEEYGSSLGLDGESQSFSYYYEVNKDDFDRFADDKAMFSKAGWGRQHHLLYEFPDKVLLNLTY